jgi:hypothetical protein
LSRLGSGERNIFRFAEYRSHRDPERAGASESTVILAHTIEVVTNYEVSRTSAKMLRAERVDVAFFDIWRKNPEFRIQKPE